MTQFFRAKALIVLVLYMFAEIANCAWALTMEVRDLPMLVVDQDQSSASRALAERFRSAPYFAYSRTLTPVDAERELGVGRYALIIEIPPGFANRIDRSEPAQIAAVADGTYSNFAGMALTHVAEIVAAFNQEVASIERPASAPAVVNQVRIWYLPGLEYTHSQLIAMLGIAALVLGVLLPAAAIVREKEAGTIEQLMVTPLRSWEFVIAKLGPMILVMFLGLLIGLLEARFLFNVPMRGNMFALYGMSLLLFFATMGIGALIGTLARNLQQTLMLTFALMFPAIFLSGTIIPVERMPDAMQWFTVLSPLRFYLPIAQGLLFKDVGLTELGPYALALAAHGMLFMTLGVSQLRKALT